MREDILYFRASGLRRLKFRPVESSARPRRRKVWRGIFVFDTQQFVWRVTASWTKLLKYLQQSLHHGMRPHIATLSSFRGVSGARTLTSHLAEPPVVAQVVRGQDAGLDMAAQIVPCATDSDPRWAGFLLASARFGGRFDWTWPTDKHTLQSLELASYARCASLTNPTIANALWAKPHGDAPFRPRRFHMSRCLV